MKPADIKKVLKRTMIPELTSKDFVSTGSTLLNLAFTDRPNRGFAKGLYYSLVGDTKSGKTFLSLTCFAEATLNSNFAKHRLIYDNVENGALMDIKKFFGTAVAKRIRPPAKDKNGLPVFSTTIEEFYDNLDDACRKNNPFIYVLDSMDGLSSDAEMDKFQEDKKARRKNKDISGSYGDGKAKINSSHLRQFINELNRLGSLLIVVSQTRANFSGYGGKAHTGGHALPFYASIEIMSSVKELITKTYKGKKRAQGTLCKIRVKKNRVSGKDREVLIPIYTSIGIDDTGSCVDYLIDEKHWCRVKTKKEKASVKKEDAEGSNIEAEEFEFIGTREKLIQHIGDNDLEKDLREIVADVWNDIEEAVQVKRKKRYE